VSKEFILSSKVLIGPPKWLNIVLDINGILCHCMEKKATNRMPFVNSVQQGTSTNQGTTFNVTSYHHFQLLYFYAIFDQLTINMAMRIKN
jgi:hypothetical protein